MSKYLSEKYLIYLSVLIILLVYSPYFILGEDSHIRVHDNLDSTIVWAKTILNTSVEPSSVVTQIMGGVPLYSVWGSYDVYLGLTFLFGSYWAYVVCKLIMAFAGFFGMYLLLGKYCLPKDCPPYIITGSSLLFSILPLWGFSATVAAAPFVIFAFFNLRHKETRWYNWLILILYAFNSSLILLGIFILIFFSIVLIYDLIKTKKINWILLGGLSVLSISYIISHFPLFYGFLGNNEFETIRKDFTLVHGRSIKDTFHEFYRFLFFSDEHQWSFTPAKQFFVVIATIFIASILLLKNKDKNRQFLFLIGMLLSTLLFISIWESDILFSIRKTLMQYLPIDIRRIYWIQPVIWYTLFAISLYIIQKNLKKSRIFICIIMLMQFGLIIKSQEYFAYKDSPTFRNFYAANQFNDIKKYINKDVSEYRVISIGLHPTISQYNGFYTVDGFSINYPLAYKLKFRKIIEKELDKNSFAKSFYEDWGGWCYAYWGAFNLNDLHNCRNNFEKIEHLDYNYDLLKEMGGEYIISAIEIDTENNKRLQFLKEFDNYKDSHWSIFLYKVL